MELDESIYTYTDPLMKKFVRKSTKGGRCKLFRQHYKHQIDDEVFNIVSKEFIFNG